MDDFRRIIRPSIGATTPPAPAAQPAAAPPAAPAAPSPQAPPKRPTNDLTTFDNGQQNRQAAESLLNDSLPWETPEPTPHAWEAGSPKAPPIPPRPAAPRPALTGPLAPQPRIPERPQRDTRPLSTSALPEAMGQARRATTDNLNAHRALQAGHKDLADVLATHVMLPDTVTQVAGKSTCVAATVQKTLARQNAGLYSQLVSELVVLGSARLPNGTTLVVAPANLAWIASQNFSPAQKLNALMQAALMELGAPGQGYLLASDSFATSPGKAPGLSLDQARKLIETLLKTPILDPRNLKAKWDGHYQAAGEVPPSDPLSTTPSSDLVRKLLEGAEKGAFAVVRARDDDGQVLRDRNGRPFVEEVAQDEESRRKRPPKKTHLVQIVAVDDAAGTVTYIDALGTQRTVEAASFAKIMLMTTRSSELEGIGSPFGAAIA